MGDRVFSRAAFAKSTTERHVPESGVTHQAERQVAKTGKMDPLVDPAGYGVIRPSRPRFKERPDGTWELTVGCPIPIEARVDTTGSMGNNVDVAMKVLPDTFEQAVKVLPGYDPQVAIGIFGDRSDLLPSAPEKLRGKFTLCRPQFEMEADKIVDQLTKMIPIRDGGDSEEDPHYGLFGAAYLTAAYINRIGLKGYDFTISDAPGRDLLDEDILKIVFGDEVFKKVTENGHKISQRDLPNTKEVVQDLLKRAHAFFLQVGEADSTTRFWTRIFGRNRMVVLPSTKLLPHVQAVIIGLTEGTLDLKSVPEFLKEANVAKSTAEEIVRSVANIPIGAQAALPNFKKRPQKGDVFKTKTDVWPMDKSELEAEGKPGKSGKPGTNWL